MEENKKKQSILYRMVSLLYPPRCPVCGEITDSFGELCCRGCRDGFKRIKEPCCKKCGKPVSLEETEYCYDCSHKVFHYKQGTALWLYDKKLRRSIADYKYNGRREYASYYIEEVAAHLGKKIQKQDPDCLVPVPVHKSRERKRGYNQAALLAAGIGKRLSIPVWDGYLVRTRKTLPQKELNDRERLENLKKAFSINPGWVVDHKPEKVMLVDDIYTTGSTIEACTRVLLAEGICTVYFVSLGIGNGY